eukprot:TRINITY_DN28212_c0_g1_i1.p1 TRINITY_DN28212_c0_g1~~TRINITY_DN28212_c0_g1_i1.p1  ORF type:complete len:542 (+),score=196.29 TRINITY_DN28212_c0_g1_i1:73-1698(+)
MAGADVLDGWPAALRPAGARLAAALKSAAAVASGWWTEDPAAREVAAHLIEEAVGIQKVTWALRLLAAAGAAKALLAAFDVCGGERRAFVERLYPSRFKRVRDMINQSFGRVLTYFVTDIVELSAALALSKCLTALGAGAALPPTFPSFFHVHAAACGVATQRLNFIRGVIVPPMIQHIPPWGGGPRGTLSASEVHALELSMTTRDLLTLELFPACVKAVVQQMLHQCKRLAHAVFNTSPPPERKYGHLLWIAALLGMAPVAYVRAALRIPTSHLAPCLLVADVINGPGGLSWVFGSLFTFYYCNRGVVCSTVLPAAFFLVCAYEEVVGRRGDAAAAEEEEEEEESLNVVFESTTTGSFGNTPQDVWLDPDDPEETATAAWFTGSGAEELRGLAAALAAADEPGFPIPARDARVVRRQLRGVAALVGAGEAAAAPALRGVVESYLRLTSTVRTLESLDPEDALDAEARCPVCQGPFETGSLVCVTPCRHAFHESCVAAWLVRRRQCPLCRTSLLGDGRATGLRRWMRTSAPAEDYGADADV